MKTTRWARRFVITILLTLMVPIVLFAPQAYAESYVAGQIGFVEPQDLSNGEVTQTQISGLSISDQPMQNTLSARRETWPLFHKSSLDRYRDWSILLHSAYQRRISCILGSRWVVDFTNLTGRSPAHDYVG